MNEYISIKTKNGNYEMERESFIRWLCLIEIIEKTEDKARDLKINLDEIDWVKPVAFKRYMKDRFRSMEIDLESEEKQGNIEFHHINNTPHILEYH